MRSLGPHSEPAAGSGAELYGDVRNGAHAERYVHESPPPGEYVVRVTHCDKNGSPVDLARAHVVIRGPSGEIRRRLRLRPGKTSVAARFSLPRR